MKTGIALCFLSLLVCAPAMAQDPAPAAVPTQVRALDGCWRGDGVVMDKPVMITLKAQPITEGAMFLVEADSHAKSNPADRYAAHLVFGGRGAPPKSGAATTISAFWIDSFGGDFTATGVGSTVANGFDVAYAYPDATFSNRWRRTTDHLTWTILATNGSAPEAQFARYDLKRISCAQK